MSDAARRLVLVVLVAGMAGIAADLVLLGHGEGGLQRIPIALLAAGAIALAALAARPRPALVRVWRGLAVLFVTSGLAGAGLHLRASLEFQRETAPGAPAATRLVKAIRAKAPPVLAPGAMVQLGLLGLVYAYRHPASRGGARAPAPVPGERHA